jgi:hypothetical protein
MLEYFALIFMLGLPFPLQYAATLWLEKKAREAREVPARTIPPL